MGKRSAPLYATSLLFTPPAHTQPHLPPPHSSIKVIVPGF